MHEPYSIRASWPQLDLVSKYGSIALSSVGSILYGVLIPSLQSDKVVTCNNLGYTTAFESAIFIWQ